MRLKTTIICLLVSIISAQASSRIFCRIKDFAVNSGLMQRHISSSLIDKSGFLWLATWNGLVRFDGYNFYTFKPTIHSVGGIYTNRVYSMKLNANNDIWCVSLDNNLYHFDTRLNTFTDVSATIPGIKKKDIFHVYTLDMPISWVIFEDGGCMRVNDIDFKTDYTLFAPGKLYQKGAKVYKVRKMGNGEEWVLTDKEAVCYNTHAHIKGNYPYIFEVSGHLYLVSSHGDVTAIKNGKASSTLHIWDKSAKVNNVSVRNGLAAIATDHGLAIVDVKRNKVDQYVKNQEVNDVQVDSHKRIWAFTADNNVTLITPYNQQSRTLSAEPFSIQTKRKSRQIFLEDKDGCVILKPTNGALSVYNEQTQTLQSIELQNKTKNELPRTEINRYIVDHQHNLWCFHEDQTLFISFNHKYFDHHKNTPASETRAMLRDSKGRAWMADRTLTIAIRTGVNQQVTTYLQPDGSMASRPAAVTDKPVYCINEDSKHRIWVGTKGDGIYLFTPSNATQTTYDVKHFRARDRKSKNGLNCDSIYAFASDRYGNTWVGTYGKGLLKAHTDANGEIRFEPIRLKYEYNKVRCIQLLNNDVLLAGTTGGLVCLSLRKDENRIYYNTSRMEEWGLKAVDVMSIIPVKGKIYLCIYGDGIREVTSKNLLSDDLHFTNTPLPTSSAADQIKTAVTDGNDIWVVAETTLVRYITGKHRYYIFDQKDFMDDIIFSEATPIVNNGIITVGTSNGQLSFSTATKPSPSKNGIYFTGIQYQNDMEIRPINDLERLTIHPEQRSFSLYLSALDYENQKNIRYRYYLKGYDKNWNYADDGQHAVNYSSLPAGNYTLMVEATGANGTWGECHREIEVSVTPLFTETIWFRLFVLLLSVGAIIGMVYAIIYLNKMRHVLQKKYSLLMTIEEVAPQIEPKSKPKTNDGNEKIIKDTVEYITQNIEQSNILIDDIARHLGMSRTAYYTRIKETTGLSPSDFIRQLRIRQALQLLRKGDLSISEVAFKVGFTDPKYFTKCFKAEMEMTPTQYIQQSRQKAEQP